VIGQSKPFRSVRKTRKSKAEAKQDAPIYESPEKPELFEKTLAAMRQIMGGLEEISSRQLTDELARIEGGPWSEWATAGAENRLVRTRSRDSSGRTTSRPLTSAPRMPGGRATSALSSSTCSEAYLGPRHPSRSSNRAVVTVAWDLALPIRADPSGCADGRRNLPLSLRGPLPEARMSIDAVIDETSCCS
jgi:hypothetical protein